MAEIFESSTRSAGDLVGVFEHDGETGYFYLYEIEPAKRIVDAIQVVRATSSLPKIRSR